MGLKNLKVFSSLTFLKKCILGKLENILASHIIYYSSFPYNYLKMAKEFCVDSIASLLRDIRIWGEVCVCCRHPFKQVWWTFQHCKWQIEVEGEYLSRGILFYKLTSWQCLSMRNVTKFFWCAICPQAARVSCCCYHTNTILLQMFSKSCWRWGIMFVLIFQI